ncbi:MAG: LysR family transcriptional regulator [Thermohalobaculum sp.]
MSIRQIEYAVAVAERGSFKAAAESLHVSQPALSVAIAGLEGHLGKPLFIRRKGSPVVPTSFGREFLGEATRMLAEFTRLVDPGTSLFERRPVVIGCYEDLAPIILAPIFSRLQHCHPEAKLSKRVGGFELLSEELRSGHVDFVITYDLGLDDSFDRKEIAQLSLRVLVGKTHPFRQRAEASLEELSLEPLVLADQGLSIRHMIDLFQQRGLSPHVAYRAATLETMRSFVANGLGVGLSYTLPRSSRSYDGKTLHTLMISDDLSSEPIVIATNRLNPPSQIAVQVMDEIAAMRLF